MKRTERRKWSLGAVMLLLVAVTTFVGCGGEDPIEPVDLGTSKVTFMHANPGRTDSIAFFRDSTSVSSSYPGYGRTIVTTQGNGTGIKYSVRALDGTILADTTTALDSSKSTIVIFSGDGSNNDIFAASTEKITTDASTAAVRFVNAARGIGARSLKINSATGSSIADAIAYMRASNSYVSVATSSTTQLVVVDPTGIDSALVIPITLMPNTSYTIVLHGSRTAVAPALKLTATAVADPS